MCSDRSFDPEAFAARLDRLVHRYFDRIAGPLMVLYVVGVAALASSSVLRAPFLRSWAGFTAVVLGPPIAFNCAVLYLWVLSDAVRTAGRAG